MCTPKTRILFLLAFVFVTPFAFHLTWETEDKIHMPSGISSQLICHLNDTIYFIGGRSITNHTWNTINTMYVLNTTNHTFRILPTKLPRNGAYFASNYICDNTSIYMFGPATDDDSATGQLWIFDISTQTLTTNISFPSTVDQVSMPCTSINPQNHSIYIAGGITLNKTSSGQLLQFNFSSNTFINATFSPIPTSFDGISGAMCVFINNTDMNGITDSKDAIIVVLGGESYTESSEDIFVYNISYNTWTRIDNVSLSEPRSFTRAIYDEDHNIILIIGGGDSALDSFLNTTDIFYVSDYSVQSASGDTLPNKIQFNTVSRYKEKIYVWGGYAMITSVGGNNTANKTRANLKEIFVFNVTSNEKDMTWTSLILVVSSCCFMLCCGCTAYLLCVKRKQPEDLFEQRASLNYMKQSE